MKFNRRDVLKVGLTGIAAGMTAPLYAGGATSKGRNVLVVIELAGGNDALNTVIPFSDPSYHQARPTIGIRDGLVISDEFALHPALPNIKRLFDQGDVAIVHGCGYPRMTRSHYRSTEVWQSAMLGEGVTTGWLGRYLESSPGHALAAGEPSPLALTGRRAVMASMQTEFSTDLASAIGSDPAMSVAFVTATGFDTHVDQLNVQGAALARVDGVVDQVIRGLGHRALVMIHSEFGRRVQENGLGGTDHGGAGMMLVCGPAVQGGFFGQFPALTDLDDGDQKYTTDFRRVYATILDRWLRADSAAILGSRFEGLDFL